MKPILAVVFAACIAAACAPMQIDVRTPFNTVDAKALLAPGKNTVKGSALIRQQGGGVVTCAGKEVALIPATAYAYERMQALYGNTSRGYRRSGLLGGGTVFPNDVPQYYELTKRSYCDAQGYFRFENVADGRFFTVTTVIWGTNDYVKEGGALMHAIEVTGGETKEIVLSP